MGPAVNFGDPRLSDRFWDKCIPEPNSGCWLWIAAADMHGYGRIGHSGKIYSSHRFAYLMLVGDVAGDLDLDHLCRMPCCVNPAHLEPVSHQENVRRGTAGHWQSAKTHCKGGHAFDSGNTLMRTRNGVLCRECRACHRESNRKYNLKRRPSVLTRRVSGVEQ